MLRSLEKIVSSVLSAKDGEIGKCKDFLFDDQFWIVRYMVADTGNWLTGRKVLISFISLGVPDWEAKSFPVKLTKEQIENSPSLEENLPVSRKQERVLFNYYGWPYYWHGPGPWGTVAVPPALFDQRMLEIIEEKEEEIEKTHLRSFREVKGYHIRATDGDIGHVEDFLADDESWFIRYLVIDTSNWLPGRKVLVSPEWVKSITWETKKVFYDLTKEQIEKSPEYDPSKPLEREFEEKLFGYYGFPPYWK